MEKINSKNDLRFWYNGASLPGNPVHSNGIEGNWRFVGQEFYDGKKVDISIILFSLKK